VPLLVYTEISMALQIRRGTDAQRQTIIFKSGELIYTTDLKDLYVGDGVTNGGTQLSPVKSVNGSTGTVVLTTDQVTQGSTNKYYSVTQTKIDSGAALVAGNAGNTGISFSYNSSTNVINAVVTNSGGGILTVSADLTPQLGGNLNLNSRNITGTGNVNVTGTISSTGKISSGILELNGSAISTSDNSYLKINSGISLGDTSYNGYMLITNNSTTLPTVDFQNHNNSADGGFVNFVRGRGTDASPLRLQSGDIIYSIGFASNGSGTTDGAAYILVSVDGATSAGVAPGAMSFAVADSAGAYLSALDIKSTGMVFTSFGLSTGTSQDLPPSTAASLNKVTSYFTTAAAETATLAVGVEGQYKNFVAQDVTAGNMVITVSNAGWKASGTGTITFSAIGQGCQLQYVNSKWHCIGNNGAVFA
jgi:hypothetical protein